MWVLMCINHSLVGMCGSCPVKSRGETPRRGSMCAISLSRSLTTGKRNGILISYYSVGTIIIIVNENNRLDYENIDNKRYKRRVGRV